MKRILCLLLALTMAMALMACGTETDPSQTDPSGTVLDATETTADPNEGTGNTTGDTSETAGEETTGEASEETTGDVSEETTGEPTETETSTQPEEETEAPTQAPHDPEVDYSEEIIGTWRVEITVATAADLGLTDLDSSLKMVLCMAFDENGQARTFADEENLSASITAFETDLVTFMVARIYADLADQGFDQSTADSKFYEKYSMSVQDYCQQLVTDMRLATTLDPESFRNEAEYSLDGNALSVGSNVMIIEIDGDTMHILSDGRSAWTALGLEYPVALSRAE